MSVTISPPMFLQFFDPNNSGAPLSGGKLFTYIAGTSTKQATWTDSTQVTQNNNPIILDSNGVALVWLDPTLLYKFVLSPANDTDPPSSPLRSVDNIESGITNRTLAQFLTQAVVGAALYPRTAAEIAAGVSPVNFAIPSHAAVGYAIVDRYGVNTNPGTTDMASAVQAAIILALTTNGLGQYGIPVRFLAGAYSIATALTFGAAVGNMIPLDIGGQGIGTQIICNLPSNTSPLFNISRCGFWLHDFLMCGNTLHKNTGIAVTGATAGIEWRISRVISMMAGVGFLLSNVNTGVLEGCQHWPGNNPLLIIAQAVTATDISHGIYMTGGFVHNVSIYDAWVTPSSTFAAGMAGIKLDCGSSYGVEIVGCLCQTRSGTNSETGIDINPSGAVAGMKMQSIYHEGAIIRLQSVINSEFTGITDGAAGGTLIVNPGSRQNHFAALNIAVLLLSDTSSFGNTWDDINVRGADAWSSSFPYVAGVLVTQGGVTYTCILANTNNVPPNATFWTVATSFSDTTDASNSALQPNHWRRCTYPLVGAIADRGLKWRKLLTLANPLVLDTYTMNHAVVRVTVGTAFTINAPLHPYNGQEFELTIRNESGGAMGAITWSGTGVTGWTNPANGFNRSVCLYYDTDFASWRQKWVGTVDVPN